MEKQQETESTEGGGGAQNCAQRYHELCNDELLLFEALKMFQNENKTSDGQRSNQPTKIQRVPSVMLAEGKQIRIKTDFRPKVIAIGPIHANFLWESRKLKLRWAAKYLTGLDEKKVFGDIKNEIEELRGLFDQGVITESIKDKDSLARMLLLDGCAILQFIYSFVWGDYSKHLQINSAQAALIQQDLFLLENQIPFKVLEIIIKGGQNEEQKAKANILKQKEEGPRKKIDLKSKLEHKAGVGDKPELRDPEKQEATEQVEDQRTKEEVGHKEKTTNEGDSAEEDVSSMETAVKRFIHMSNMAAPAQLGISWPKKDDLDLNGGIHLLDLLRRALLDHIYSPNDLNNRVLINYLDCFGHVLVFILKLPLYFLKFVGLIAILVVLLVSFILYCLIQLVRCKRPLSGFGYLRVGMFLLFCLGVAQESSTDPNSLIYRRSFRNIQELKAAGIELKPNKNSSLRHISFKKSQFFSGCLQLHPILVDNSTACKLLNLVAYEMCPDYRCKIKMKLNNNGNEKETYDYGVTSYLSFLDSLIDTEQDVKDLRAAHILRHRLSSDAEVAKLFNDISPNSVPDDAYVVVNSEIQNYYEWKIPVWIAQFRHEYLNSPWTCVALVAAATALALTAVQTYFAVHPR